MASGSLPLAVLLDSLLQKSYHELTVLAELLPRKSDVDRKIGIVSFARQTRLQLVRLLALVKWAGSSDSVQKCSEMSELLTQQSWLYEDTANQLVHLARHQLLMACMPNFSLAPALDVLCTGSYPRLPSCINDNIIPPSPLSGREAESALCLLTVAVRRRLLTEATPPQMTVVSLERGVVVFEVPHEFRLSLSVVGDDQQLPWRLVNLEVLVGRGLPGSPPLCHSQQIRYLTQLAQSHLVAGENPLALVFTVLHKFCLSLLLDCLHTQASHLSSTVCGSHVKVEEYQAGKQLRLGYWCPHSPTFTQSTGALWPRMLICVDPSSSHPITTIHTPPLPEGSRAVEAGVDKVCLEEVIAECVRTRATAKLEKLGASLKATQWEQRVLLCKEPLCLHVCLPVRGGESELVMSVDVRTGEVVVGVEPCAVGEGVGRELAELERALMSDCNLPSHLSRLQSQLFLDRILVCARELGLSVTSSLPLPSPPPLPSPHCLYVRLLPMAYLAVCAGERDGEVEDRYFLVEVAEASVAKEGGDSRPPVPRIFHSVVTMTELDNCQLVHDSLRSVAVKRSPAVLKRKLQCEDHSLPSTKRVCVVGSCVSFPPVPVLCSSHLLMAQIKTSLKASGICGYQELWEGHGAPCLGIWDFPLLPSYSHDLHTQLSSLLRSCLLFPSPVGHKLVMVFSPLIPASQAPDVILHHSVPVGMELGPALLALWQSQLTLLSLALELLHYLEDPLWPLGTSCQLSHFGYDSLTVTYGEHSLSLHGGMAGPHLSFSPECPHSFLSEPLQHCLLATLSLPVLLKGIVGTGESLSMLHRFTATFPGSSLVPLSAAQVQLQYNSLSLSINILSGGCMEFTNLQYAHQRLPMSMPGIPSPLGFLKAFIHGFLGVEDAVTELEDVATPRPVVGRLQPSQMPISSPSRPLLPSSPLPSIPSLPTPPSFPHSLPSLSPWSYLASPDQLRSLLLATPTTTPTSPLMVFIASLAQLCQFWQQAAMDRAQPPPTTGQLLYVSTDRRVYHYRTETLNLFLSIDNPQQPTLQLLLKPARENCWSQQELQMLMDFWKKEVACPPFALPAVISYVKLLQLPLMTLKSCVQLLAYHLSPPSGLAWSVSLCMVIPQELGDDIPAQLKPGTAGIIYKGKLLLMIQLTHLQDGSKGLIPLMHDLRNNSTYNVRNPHQSCIIANIDSLLKKVSQEYARLNTQESSIFPCVKALLTNSTLHSQ